MKRQNFTRLAALGLTAILAACDEQGQLDPRRQVGADPALPAAQNFLMPPMQVPDAVLEDASRLCMRLGTDGLRAELTLLRAARALACLDVAPAVELSHMLRMAPSALRHRLRRDPLDDAVSTTRVSRAVAELFPG